MIRRFLLICALILSLANSLARAEEFELRDGDRVALIGDTLIEREQTCSYLETIFHLHWPERTLTFRNLGWSGDTVRGDARSYEHAAERGFENLTKQVHALKPTVVFLGYGMAESFQGDAGLPRFRQGFERMLDMLKDLNARIVLIGPIRHENLGPPLPDPAAHNRDLRKYADVIADIAAKRGHRFIDLFELLDADSGPPLTDNGIHLTQHGYARAAAAIAKAMSAKADLSSSAAERIRQLAIQKNIQYFNQWRPANEPYLFGFRKAEQSRNQVELPRFSKTIEQLEKEIRELAHSTPVSHESKPQPPPPVISRAADAGDPTDPENERKSFKVADGFEVNLYAADPLMAKPIQMNWDARGRLWVASSSQYPQIRPGEAPADKIIVLEDTNNDGRADSSRIFADGLLIPTGVEPAGDGSEAYVANSTELLHLKDTDNDGKADQRRIVLSGFGTEDTHHLIHTFRWGVDGRLYFNQSIYINSHVETPHGVRRLKGSGVWRFHPDKLDFDVFSRGMINPWGHAHDEWGQSLGTDGAGDGGVYDVFPGSAFHSAIGYERVMHGMNPGSPKYCGLEIVSGRHFPDDWQGNAITNDFRANRVVRYQLTDRDGTYVSKQMPDVIVSTDVAFRPIDVKMGPDGAVYIADWYNPIINHGEVDFRDPRRDKTRGRIWRITAKGRPLVEKPKLVGVPVADVLEQLKSPEGWTRHQARIVLRSLGPRQVLPVIERWRGALDRNDPRRAHNRLEALWTSQSLDTPQPALLNELLQSPTPQVRAAATRVVGDWLDALPDAMELLAARVADEHPRVRLEAVRSLARVPSPRAIEIATRALDQPKDPQLDYALWVTAKETEATWMPAFAAGELRFDGKPAHASFALQAVKSPAAAAALARQVREGKTPPAERANVLSFIALYGGADEAKLIYDTAIADGTDAVTRAAALAALEKSIRRGIAPPADADAARIAILLTATGEGVRVAAIRLAGAWRAVDVRPALMRALDAPDTTAAVRQAAIDTLVELGGESGDFFRRLDSPNNAFHVRVAALVGLSALDLKDAARRAADLLAGAAPVGADPSQLVAGFLQREGGANALAAALSSKRLEPPLAVAALRHVESTGRDEKALANYLRNAAGISVTSSKTLSRDELARRVAEVQRYGDAARGEMIFRRADTSCFKCHAIQGAGGQLGPDLGSIGASSPVDYLIESMIEPNKAIKDGYDSVIVKTKAGDVHSGIKVSSDDTQLVLRDAVHDRIVIPRDSVRGGERSGGSLMPTGLIDHLPSWEQINLLRFLAELGKPGPYQPGSASIVRRWRVLPAAAAEQVAADTTALQSPARDAALPWTPAYALVSGDLPAEAMAADGQHVAFARAEIDVTAAGKVGVRIDGVTGLSLQVDGVPHEIRPDLELDLTRGPHTLTFKIDVAARGQGLRVELRDVPGSAAGAARPVGGR